MTAVHSFRESFSRSKTAAQVEYETRRLKEFGLFRDGEITLADEITDRAGGDYRIENRRGREYLVDVKCRMSDVTHRWKNQPDLAIEWQSVAEAGKPGWTVDPEKKTTHVVYLWRESDWPDAYVFEFERLRIAAMDRRREWECRFGKVSVPNDGYHTVCSFVPLSVVLDAVNETGTVHSLKPRRVIPAGSINYAMSVEEAAKELYRHLGPEDSERLAYEILRQQWRADSREPKD